MTSRLLADSLVIAQRNLLRYLRQPQIAVFILIQPVMFLLLFQYVFGGAITIPGLDYGAFLVPGIIAQSVAFNTVGSSVGMAEDLKGGIIDRYRSLPMSHLAVLGGRVLADTFVAGITTTVMLVIAYIIGFRVTTSPVHAIGAFAIIVGFFFAFAWVAVTIGLWLREPEAVQSAGFLWLFPMNFISSVFVPPETMPGPLQAFAAINPFTHVVNSARVLTVGGYTCDGALCTDITRSVGTAVSWYVGITILFMALGIRAWRRLD